MVLTTIRDRRSWSGWFDRNDRWYDRVAAERGGDLMLGRLEAWASPRSRMGDSWPAAVEGQVPAELAFLVTTSDLGLLEYRHGRFTQILAGHTFGLGAVPDDDVDSRAAADLRDSASPACRRVIGFQRTGLHGRLVLLDAEPGSAGLRPKRTSSTTLLWGLTRGVHQIRARGDELVVTDTYRNRLLVFSLQDLLNFTSRRGQGWRRAVRHIVYPEGPLTQGQRSVNYRHFNSLLARSDGSWLVMAHNDTLKTGRPSMIYTLDHDFQVVDIKDTGGSECHDLLLDSLGRLMFCRSAEGTLAVDGADVLTMSQFTRGLAAGPDLVLVGGSPRGDRDHRRSGRTDSAVIHILDAAFTQRGVLSLPATQVHELHLLPAIPRSPANAVASLPEVQRPSGSAVRLT